MLECNVLGLPMESRPGTYWALTKDHQGNFWIGGKSWPGIDSLETGFA